MSKHNDEKKIIKSHVVLVEGKDDVTFLEAVLKKLNLLEKIQIYNLEGIGNLIKEVKSLFQQQDKFSFITAIIDADDDFLKAKQNVETAYKELLDIQSFAPFIFPDNQNTGMLETVLIDYYKAIFPEQYKC